MLHSKDCFFGNNSPPGTETNPLIFKKTSAFSKTPRKEAFYGKKLSQISDLGPSTKITL
jgi:hypothetical protein